MADWRAGLLAGLEGDVLEIGAGTGLNLAHYPGTVRRLVLTDPEPAMLDRLRPRLTRVAEGVATEVQVADAGQLPFADDSFDTVVATLVLCSVPDPAAALAEVRRVLRPDGRLVFLEHVAADHRPDRLRWQQRIDPLWKRLAGGCRLTRRTADAITAAGFEVDELTRESARKTSPLTRTTIRGSATSP